MTAELGTEENGQQVFDPIVYTPEGTTLIHILPSLTLILHQDVIALINTGESAPTVLWKTHSGFVLDSGLFHPKED